MPIETCCKRLLIAVALIVVVLGGAVAGRAQAASPIVSDPTQPPTETMGMAIPPGQIDQAIRKLNGLVGVIMRKTGIPGMAVAVVRGGKTVYARGFGVRRAGAPEKVDPDTVFQIASLSKPVGATVVAREVGLHVIAWDTPIVQHLPWFALQDGWVTQHVTIADMYAHRSGLPDHAGDDLEDVGYDRRQVLERLRFLPLASFRDTYAYTNFGVTAAAEAVATAAKTDWASLSDQAIYQPLGMTETSSRFADFEKRADRAVGHVKSDGVFVPKYQRQPDAQSPAGGVSSSVRDMAHWMAMVLQGGVYDGRAVVAKDALLPAVTAEIVSGHAPSMTARPNLYGYGFIVGTQPSGMAAIAHSGGFASGVASNVLMIPSAGVGIVTLSNAWPIGAVEALDAEFADLVQFGAVTRDWLHDYGVVTASITAAFGSQAGKPPPARPTPAAGLPSYAGVYANAYAGEADIVQRGDGLVLKVGPAGMEFPLRHWDGNEFAYTPTGENAPDGSVSTVTFTMGPSGQATGMAIEFFAASGRGDFVRKPN
jgi:CubicO group peptidase (beta-lactamase class C family)